ncbi:hypothetical protein C7974DRAFT_134838 [Boeremia exigua]|uniref:uncharacterized protein n=1 Tax=Boeremia exigua TaxID=749465 RepID=UPI001E8E4A5A|nr:uncharacterized protein C7974DRAFT_134838 [Boeremia exigua]KAH6639586.1 hypothetical protein C7974DRAFT_134838 [Boeremia exigua]
MVVPRILVLCTLPFLALGAKKREVPSHFGLYGYGEGFGGFPLFYADGYAYIGEAAQSNISNAATVDFSLGTGNMTSLWIGNPNTTLLPDANTANWADTVFYLPDNTTSDKRVGFLSNNNATDGAIKTGFSFYGSTAVLIGETGTLESSFYALQVSERVHRLYWNETSLGQKPVVLRAVAPSMPPL